MKLSDFFNEEGAPTAKEIAEKSGVSYTTIKAARRGLRIVQYEVAKKISEATGNKVSIEELCE